MTVRNTEQIKTSVREHYAGLVKSGESCYSSSDSCGTEFNIVKGKFANRNGYTDAQLSSVPADATEHSFGWRDWRKFRCSANLLTRKLARQRLRVLRWRRLNRKRELHIYSPDGEIGDEEYTIRDGVIRSPMVNVVTMLTENHPGDGCFTVIPGSHKRNFNLNPKWKTAGLDTPGAIEITGDPGDVMIFTEALTHAGAAKTTKRRRTTLQYNHVQRNRACPMWDHHNARHYWMPPSIRKRFTPEQRALADAIWT